MKKRRAAAAVTVLTRAALIGVYAYLRPGTFTIEPTSPWRLGVTHTMDAQPLRWGHPAGCYQESIYLGGIRISRCSPFTAPAYEFDGAS